MKALFRLEVEPNYRIPWYYGLAYRQWDHKTSVWYPIPVNYIVRAGISVRFMWDRIRSRSSWVDKRIDAAVIMVMDEEKKRYQNRRLEDAREHRIEGILLATRALVQAFPENEHEIRNVISATFSSEPAANA